MTYNNMPKNLTNRAVLVRGGKPDYTKLAAAAFPTPTADEAGAILENYDTGDLFRWSGTIWIAIEVTGQRRTLSSNFILEITKGNVPGHSTGFIVGGSRVVQTTQSCTVWDLGGNYVRATSDTQYYISSSDVLDTAVTVLITGVDEDSVPFSATVTTNGRTQVAFSIATTMAINVAIVTGSTSAVGDLYIAETDTLTLGVPNTASKIKAVVPLARKDSATIIDTGTEFASDGISHLGIYHVAADHTLYFRSAIMYTAKNQDVELSGRVKFDGGVWLNRSPACLYQSGTIQDFNMWLTLPEKTQFEVRAIAGALANSVAHFQFQFVLVENAYV